MDGITAPKTKAQRDFEINAKYLLQVLADLTPEQQKQVIDLAVFLANE